jgi:peptidoglycan/xylan/chitin deacetylase (PgdA/CDA1 family)
MELNMKKIFPSGAATLRFDDGWRCIYENALPILEEANLKSTHYIISGCLDDEQFPRYMNVDHIQDLAKRGHEIGCHTVSHKHLTAETTHIIKEEIILSKKYLEKLVGSVETFAYPFGEYDNRVLDVVKQAGFWGARSIHDGFNEDKTDTLLLKCKAVMVKTSISEVKKWIDFSQNNNVWLILMFHQIDNEGREWSSRPETLREVVDYVLDTKITTITIGEGVKKILRR